MLRERVFNFTASLVGNLTVNRTGTFRLSPRLFLPRGSGKVSPFTALQKKKRIQLINPEDLLLMILAHGCFFCFVLGYSYMGTYQSLFCE